MAQLPSAPFYTNRTENGGTGPLTLGPAIEGDIDMKSLAISVDYVTFYLLRDGNSKEWGQGTIKTDGTFTRDTVQGTIVNGDYDADPATPLDVQPKRKITINNVQQIYDLAAELSQAQTDGAAITAIAATVTAQAASITALSSQAAIDAQTAQNNAAAASAALNGAFAHVQALVADDPAILGGTVWTTDNDSDPTWPQRCAWTAWFKELGPFPRLYGVTWTAETITIWDLTASAPVAYCFFDGTNMMRATGSFSHNKVMLKEGILVSATTVYGSPMVDFKKDQGDVYRSTSALRRSTGTISDRNDPTVPVVDYNDQSLLNGDGNDVDLVVLANAPRDPVTLMLVPTVAVANDGGLDLIDVPGATGIVHITTNVVSDERSLSASIHNGKLYFNMTRAGDGANAVIGVSDIPTSSTVFENLPNLRQFKSDYGNIGSADLQIFDGAPSYDRMVNALVPTDDGFIADRQGVVAGSLSGKGFVKVRFDDDGNETFQAVSTTVATPDISKDTIACLMADTEVGTIDGVQIAANGDYSTDTVWQKGTGWTISSGAASCDGTQTGNSSLTQLAVDFLEPIVAGKLYAITFDLTVSAGALNFINFGGGIDGTDRFTAGENIAFIEVTNPAAALTFAADINFIGSITNVEIREAIPDRSGKGNHAVVEGSVPATVVATGSEAVAYGPFTNGRFKIPHSSSFDVGSGDMEHSFAFQTSNPGEILLSRDDGTDYDYRVFLFASGLLAFQVQIAGSASTVTSTVAYDDGVYHAGSVRREGTTLNLEVDGAVYTSNCPAGSMNTATNPVLTIGQPNHTTGLTALTGKILNLVPEAAALTASQRLQKRRWNEAIVQPNTKITLQGNSDQVNAVAVTRHHAYVGTDGGGVSVFNNNTRTVTRHITHTDAGITLTSDVIRSISVIDGRHGPTFQIVDDNGKAHFDKPSEPLNDREGLLVETLVDLLSRLNASDAALELYQDEVTVAHKLTVGEFINLPTVDALPLASDPAYTDGDAVFYDNGSVRHLVRKRAGAWRIIGTEGADIS